MASGFSEVNSLIYGRKLWFLKPPAEQEFRKTVVYEEKEEREEEKMKEKRERERDKGNEKRKKDMS